jgi:hypothetical protein
VARDIWIGIAVAAKKKSSVSDKVKTILKNTAKQTGKDLLMLGTIVGPGKAVKAAKTVSTIKASKKAAAVKKQAAVRQETVRIAKNSVKVKTAARQKPGKKDISTLIKKRAIRNEQIRYAERGDDFVNSGIRPGGPYSQGKTKLLRQIKASDKKKSK